MFFLSLIPFYLRWHYSEGLKDLSKNWKNFISFVLHFFSLGLLFRTWLTPFGRLTEDYQRGLHLEAFFETLVTNTLMRIVGFVLRSFVMVFGVIALSAVVILGPVVLIIWLLIPFLIPLLLFVGLGNIKY